MEFIAEIISTILTIYIWVMPHIIYIYVIDHILMHLNLNYEDVKLIDMLKYVFKDFFKDFFNYIKSFFKRK